MLAQNFRGFQEALVGYDVKESLIKVLKGGINSIGTQEELSLLSTSTR